MRTVCRTEIADVVEGAFEGPAISPADLVEFASEHGARPPVLRALGRLHGTAYRDLRDLWDELSDIPIER